MSWVTGYPFQGITWVKSKPRSQSGLVPGVLLASQGRSQKRWQRAIARG
ncbi:MAG: hypothetical protein HC890_02280 [Chloroflexaceae bacterium]|nr:hypothetical protein [Chloroflexaceae bacterium]